jgi:hypothetical protein
VTKTKGGARLVRKWLRQPLLSRVDLEQRYDLVDARTRGREPTTAAWEPLGNQRAVAAAVAAAAAVVAAAQPWPLLLRGLLRQLWQLWLLRLSWLLCFRWLSCGLVSAAAVAAADAACLARAVNLGRLL